MKFRIVIAAALAAGLLLAVSGAQAATPVIDGKKVKVLTKTVAAPGVTQDLASASDYDATLCDDATLCPKLTFIYAPAKGAKTGLMFTTTWTSMQSDIDVSVVEYDSKGVGTQVGTCGGGTFSSEKVYLGASDLKKGAKYAVVMHLQRALNETITTKVEIGVPDTTPTTVPAAADALAINCTL